MPRPRVSLPEGARRLTATTDDDVPLSGVAVPGPAGRLFVVAHGLCHSTSRPATTAVIGGFAAYGGVLALDFRGHGRSGGRSSVGRDEVHDLDAAMRLARQVAGDDPVTMVGFSMGGAVAIRQAALSAGPLRPDALVGVSAAARWFIRDSSPMRRVHWMLEHPLGPVAGRWLGVRLGDPWADVPPGPLESIADVGCPVLLVHGTADRYFSPHHATALHRASGGGGPLWLEPGMGHAEAATSPDLIARIAAWAPTAAGRQAHCRGAQTAGVRDRAVGHRGRRGHRRTGDRRVQGR